MWKASIVGWSGGRRGGSPTGGPHRVGVVAVAMVIQHPPPPAPAGFDFVKRVAVDRRTGVDRLEMYIGLIACLLQMQFTFKTTAPPSLN